MIEDEERGCGREEILKMEERQEARGGKKQWRNEGMEEKGRKWKGCTQYIWKGKG